MKRIFCIVLAVALIAATAVVITGCNDKKDNQTATQAATVAATVAPTVAATQEATVAATQAVASTNAAQQAQSGDAYAGYTQEQALQQAVNSNPGYYANSIERGNDASGAPAWVVVMINDAGEEMTAYVKQDGVATSPNGNSNSGNQTATNATEAVAATENNGNNGGEGLFAGYTREQAVQRALGELPDCSVDSITQGTNVYGNPSWVVTMTNTEGRSFICYLWEEGVITNPAN